MRMNFKNIFMGLTAWLVLGFALHGSDKDKGQLGFVKEQKEVAGFPAPTTYYQTIVFRTWLRKL